MFRMFVFKVLPSMGIGVPFFVVVGSCRPVAGGVEMTVRGNRKRYIARRPTGSPHEAVWRGVAIAARRARMDRARGMIIRTASYHVKNQAKGKWPARSAALKPWADRFRRSPLAPRTRWL